MGREGGIATFLKYGREHMAALGRKGYMVTCARWFGGDEAEMNRWLHHQAAERQIERMVAAKLDARIAAGETCAVSVRDYQVGARAGRPGWPRRPRGDVASPPLT